MAFYEAVAQVALVILVIVFIEVRSFERISAATDDGLPRMSNAFAGVVAMMGIVVLSSLMVVEYVALRGLLLAEPPSRATGETIGMILFVATLYGSLPLVYPLLNILFTRLSPPWSSITLWAATIVYLGVVIALAASLIGTMVAGD